MTIMYKLVDQNFTTMNNTVWELNKTNKATGKGNKMCTDGVLHCYKTPEQAVSLNIIHASIKNPILLKIVCSEILDTDGLKYCCKEQTPIEILELPVFTTGQKVTFAIKCALLVCKEPDFVKWANAWLDGSVCSKESAAYILAAHTAAYINSARSAGADSVAYYANCADSYAANGDAYYVDYYAARTANSASLKFESKEEFATELDKIIASL